MVLTPSSAGISGISALVIAGIIIRPWKVPEAVWAVLGALALVLCALISVPAALGAVRKGMDVYLFLTGMMLLAEVARQEGLFEWLAACAVKQAQGSATRLFLLIYGVGTLVTVFLSNDATAVVLTPAVYAATKQAKANPLPYLFICAFIANAASFVLPISNPANLVVFGSHVPPLVEWLRHFALASTVSIGLTYGVLRFTQWRDLQKPIARIEVLPALSPAGRLAASGIALTAAALITASALDWQLGLPTLIAGALTTLAIVISQRRSPWPLVKEVSWSVLPLVAGLFVLVEAVEATGVLKPIVQVIQDASGEAPRVTALATGGIAGVMSNLVNNLPLGLLAGTVATSAHLSPQLAGALLIGVDLGPNLSVTGSLATILWLVALRREGQEVSGWKFLALGVLVMPPALIGALASLIAFSHP